MTLADAAYSELALLKIAKIWRHYSIKALAILGLSAVLGLGIQSPAISSERAIFGEMPTRIEDYFGQYWTRLTLTNSEGDRTVTYTYSPGAMRSFFDNAEDLRLSVRFINDEAVAVRVHQNGAGFNIPADKLPSADNSTSVFDDVFAYIFGYQPPIMSRLDRQSLEPNFLQGTLHSVTYCMSEEIAMTYEWISTQDYIWFITFEQEPDCI
ncbi:MAG: hypothetical protein F6K00_25550 [Leptolyngbya sp. SIOISBB]|nr:hypothetical protein [Leptolyngbya sp. SIOISBB]